VEASEASAVFALAVMEDYTEDGFSGGISTGSNGAVDFDNALDWGIDDDALLGYSYGRSYNWFRHRNRSGRIWGIFSRV
jgi:hypothetical protein